MCFFFPIFQFFSTAHNGPLIEELEKLRVVPSRWDFLFDLGWRIEEELFTSKQPGRSVKDATAHTFDVLIFNASKTLGILHARGSQHIQGTADGSDEGTEDANGQQDDHQSKQPFDGALGGDVVGGWSELSQGPNPNAEGWAQVMQNRVKKNDGVRTLSFRKYKMNVQK